MLQLDALRMDDIAPKQDFLPFDENHSRCVPGYDQAADDLHCRRRVGSEPLNVVPLAGLMYGAAMACALWKTAAHPSAPSQRFQATAQKSLSSFGRRPRIWKNAIFPPEL